MPRELRPLSQAVQNKHLTKRTAFLTQTMSCMDKPRIGSSAELLTGCADCHHSHTLNSVHNGSISRDPVPLRQVRTHVTPPVGRLGAVALPTSFHNGSVSRDSMPLRYRAKRKGSKKRLLQDATKNAKFLHRSRLLRNLDFVHIYWGASAIASKLALLSASAQFGLRPHILSRLGNCK